MNNVYLCISLSVFTYVCLSVGVYIYIYILVCFLLTYPSSNFGFFFFRCLPFSHIFVLTWETTIKIRFFCPFCAIPVLILFKSFTFADFELPFSRYNFKKTAWTDIEKSVILDIMKIVVLDNNSHSYQLIYVCHQIEFQTNLKNEKKIFTKLKKKKKKEFGPQFFERSNSITFTCIWMPLIEYNSRKI